MSVLVFDKENFKPQVLESDKPVLVDFWSPGCGPCQIMEPIIKELAEYFEGRAKVGKLNVLKNPEIAQKYRIMGVPTLIIFKNGELKERATGMRSKKVIVDKINSLL